ncbi:glycosyltransferase [Acetobacter musti]|uniref:Glycosyltransferase n=1 Tax=Acetobacter musti TaxID=864732 RepID=A0ABX0JS04_9PROT|nr:Hint domain-containing protein [Acetobacter musti]NHN85311.1 glycosyltransferase [Acetobacter musti]
MVTSTTNSGTQNNVTVSGGNTLDIIGSGVVSGLTVSSGGTVYVNAGGSAAMIDLAPGGFLYVEPLNNGTATGTQGTVSGGVLSGNGAHVGSNSVIEDVTVASGGMLTVDPGGLASGVTFSGGAQEKIAAGGSDIGAVLESGTTAETVQDVKSQGVASGATVSGYAVQKVEAGGSAFDTTVSGTVDAYVINQDVTGYASGTTILAGGQQTVENGGSAYNVVISSGGKDVVNAGGLVSGVTISSGGALDIQPGGGSASAVSIGSGGYMDAMAGAVLSGVTIASGGTLEVGDTSTAVSALSIASGANLMIDLDPGEYSVSYSDTALEIMSGGAVVDTITLASPIEGLDSGYFTSSAATGVTGASGFELNYIACYCPGTLIAVEDGEAAIETLRIGDSVRTASGELRPIRWIGRRSYAAVFVSRNKKLLPVTIRAGAIADNVPRRDLRVSPLHAMSIDGALIPASSLINGTSIVQDDQPGDVSYIHLELESHDLLLAEGAPSESYVEDGSRWMFQNASEYFELYPDAVREEAVYCAPRIEGGERLATIWRNLADRAGLGVRNAEAAESMPGVEVARDGTDQDSSGRLHGWLDFADRTRICGWAWNEDQPWEKLRVDVFVDDEYLTTVSAADQRPDLAASGFGTGWAGFTLNFSKPLSLSEGHMIAVRYAGTERHLNASPWRVAASSEFGEELETFVERAVSGLETDEERLRVLKFVTRQADRICQQKAVLDAGCAERKELERARRLAGKAASDIPKIRRALVIDEHFPRPGHDAGSEAIRSHIRALGRLGYHVTFAVPGMQVEQDLISGLEAEGISVAAAPFYTSPEDLLRRQAGAFEVVYLHRVSVASSYGGLVRRYMSSSRLIYSVADLHHLRLARQAGVEGRVTLAHEAARMRTFEVAAALNSDVVLTHSSVEAAELRRLIPALNVHVVPWGVSARPVATSASDRHGIAFLAHYRHTPNRDAAEWLIREVMPLVWKRAPDIRCVLAGTDMGPETEALACEAGPDCGGVGIVRDVENLRDDLFEQVRLGIAPLRFGAGLKGKVLETFAAGLPCVMTPVAAEGIDLPDSLKNLVQSDAENLAEEIVRLHAAPESVDSMGQAALRFIEAHYGEDSVGNSLAAALGRPEAASEATGPFRESA